MNGDKKKKLLLISPFAKPDIGGVESHLFKLMNYLESKSDLTVSLVSYRPLNTLSRYSIYERCGRFEHYRMPWFGNGLFRRLERYFPLNFFYLYPGLFVLSLLVLVLRRRDVQVIHAHGLVAATIGSTLKRLTGVRLIVSTHAVYGVKPNTLVSLVYKSVLKRADKILAVGEPSRDELRSIGLPLLDGDIHRNWVNLDFYKPMSRFLARKRFGLDPKRSICLFVGRMIEIKGELLLLKVAGKFETTVTFLFVGDGPTKTIIRDQSISCGNVIVLDNIQDVDMPYLYNVADVFASPVQYEEGFATVYLEALACGVPVVTASRGCLPFFLSNDIGLLLEGEVTEEKLIYGIQSVLDRNMNGGMTELCRGYAEQHFGIVNAERIYSEYG